MKISCCPIRASRALLIGPEYVLFEVVVCCLSIAKCAPILEWEPQFVPQTRPYGQTMLKSGLRWSATWWRGAIFSHRRPVDCWILAGGIDRFPINTLDYVDSSGFVVWIWLRANMDDQVVIDGVPIGGHVGPSIGFVIAGCLTTAWNVVAEFLRHRWNMKPMVIVRRFSCSWVGWSRLLSSPAVNDSVPNKNHMSVKNSHRRSTAP
jgi:hypothetical protein